MSSGRSVWCWIAVFLVALPGVAQQRQAASAAHAPARIADDQTARALVERYFTAYERKDLDGMMELWLDTAPDSVAHRKGAQQFFAGNDNITVSNLSVQVLMAEEGKVHFRTRFELSAVDIKTGKPAAGLGKMVRSITCVKTEHGWRISQDTDTIEDLASGLLSSGSETERGALLAQEKDLVTPNLANALIRQGARFSANGNYEKAISAFMLAQGLASELGNPESLGRAYLDLGVAYRRQSNYQKALESFQRAMNVARESGNQHLMAQCLTDRGIVQFHLGEYKAALDSYSESLKLAQEAHEDQSIEHAQANMANVLRVQGSYAPAEQFYLKALGFVEKQANDPRELARILNSLGNLALVQSDYSKALQFHMKALALLEKGGDPDTLGNVLNNIGSSLAAENDYTEALAYHRRSLELAQQTGNKHNIIVSLAAISDVEHLQGNYAPALDDAGKALALAEEIGEKKVVTEILNILGEIHILRGDYAAALAAHLRGLALAEGLNYEEMIAQECSNISSDYFQLGKFEQAIALAERASTTAERIGARMAIFEAQTTAGKVYRAMGQTDQASEAFAQAIAAVESMRSDLAGSEETRQRFFENKTAPYLEMAGILVAQHRNEEALLYAERAKGRALLDVLANGRVNITKAMTAGEREREEDFESQLVSLNRQIEVARTEDKLEEKRITELKSALDQTRLRYSEFRTALYAAHPELQTQRGQIEPISLGDAANLMPGSRTAALEFLVGEQKTYLFVLTPTGQAGAAAPELKVYTIKVNAKDLDRKAQDFLQQLSQRDLRFGASAAALYDLLLRPAQAQLSGVNTLLIIPDGALWNLPFQSLRPRPGHYLLEDYAISYAPSLTILHEMVRLRLRRAEMPDALQRKLLAMGNPTVATITADRAKLSYRDERLVPLPEATQEVRAIADLYKVEQSRIFVEEDATEDRFKAQAGEFSILHLATHGLLNDSNPMYSHLLLAPGSPKEDGLLEAREIVDLDLRANLAVLSACETARGQITPGEGVIGLSWAFFVAGVPTTVVSQWNVESLSTAELMLAFHRGLKVGQTKASAYGTARALQRAELQLLHSPRYSHPFYWAGFIVMGDPR